MTPEEYYTTGARRVRDSILAMIVGLQNKIGNDTGSERYQAYQEVYELIAETHGDMFVSYKR